MIKDFFIKKENIFISVVAVISIFCVVLGFLFLFFNMDSKDGPRTIPNTVYEIKWKQFSSKILGKKIQYPEYMYIDEHQQENAVGLTITEFEPKDLLTYFSNQNNVSVYPLGLDTQFFYAIKKESDYTSSTGQEFGRIEYLTTKNQVWATMLTPKVAPKGWQSRGFIWIQSDIKNKTVLCMSKPNLILADENCDPYNNQMPIYQGEVAGQFMRFGYEIVNKNTF